MRSATKAFPIFFLVACTFSAVLEARQPCQPPRLDLSQSGRNIFSSQQEQQLGEIMAQQLGYLRISNDPVVTAYLEKVGDRLARHLPPIGFPLRYFVVETSWPDAFTLPGGRIYITRSLIVQLRNPDELAAILGHEMGHVVTHQSAIEVTFLLEKVLGVTGVTGREDIQRKIDDLYANWRNNRAAFRQVAHHREQKQLLADQVALYAVAAAGYSPEVYPELFRRLTLTSRGTGNWLSDLFHTTKPDQIRLRALLKTEQAMPKACVERRPRADAVAFQRWRKTVLDFNGWGKQKAELHDVVARVKLQPLSLGEVKSVRFSQDGKFLLAQRDQNVDVFRRNPFAFLFRIYAPDAQRPRFTANSRSVAFTGVGSRVQVWDIASRKRVLSYTPQLPSECAKSLLSPDATVLACLRVDGTLDLIQLPSGKLMFERRGFTGRARRGRWGLVLPDAPLNFSPDSHYFLTWADYKTVALDLRTSKPIKLPRRLKGRLKNGFTFLSDGRLLTLRPTERPAPILVMHNRLLPYTRPYVVRDTSGSENFSVLFEFPSGKVVGRAQVGLPFNLAPATDADYLLIGPLQKHPLGILDLATGKIKVVLDQRAADVYEEVYAHQLVGGDLGLYDLETRNLQSRAPFPPGEGPYFRAIASPDLKWLATPAGAIWDLSSGKMVFHLRKFYDGVFDGENALVAYFPRYRDRPGTIAKIDLIKKEIKPQPEIKNNWAYRLGPYLVSPEPHQTKAIQGVFNPCRWKYPDFDPMDCDVTYEISNARSGKKLWTRRFPKEVPDFYLEPERGRVVINWFASDAAVEDEIKQFPQLEGKWATARKRPDEEFVEILDSSNGSIRHAMFVNGGDRRDFLTAGHQLLAVHDGYIEIYSLATARREGEIPGEPSAVSSKGRLLAVTGDAQNLLNIYGLKSRHRVDQLAFPADIVLAQFSRNGKRLLVLTRTQTAYILDMAALRETLSSNP